jgi:hypothetical protein
MMVVVVDMVVHVKQAKKKCGNALYIVGMKVNNIIRFFSKRHFIMKLLYFSTKGILNFLVICDFGLHIIGSRKKHHLKTMMCPHYLY